MRARNVQSGNGSDLANRVQFSPEHATGHYESVFLRANDPLMRRALWVRHTIFNPAPGSAISKAGSTGTLAELWAIYFDADNGHIAVKNEFPFSTTLFARDEFHIRIPVRAVAQAEIKPGLARGSATTGSNQLNWDLKFSAHGDGARELSRPLYLLPENLYAGSFPAAKSLVSQPLTSFSGTLRVNGRRISVRDWHGSINHNWGRRHTDRYAWGQVAGFDGAPETFLELATAQIKLGPLWTPPITILVLRRPDGNDIRLNGIARGLLAGGKFSYRQDPFTWEFRSANRDVSVRGRIRAPRSDFVCLRYFNPPGGGKFCLNSKLAECEL
ncbi:MAG: hypothetical protein KDK34_10740, partial [Leptospiraceae bacterium]|nr:hypothetical protein [Leptospiraceae bacterium]